MMRCMHSFLLAFLLVCLTACSGSGTRQIQINEQDRGQEVRLRRGDQLVLTLKSNPSTGYQWEIIGGVPWILALQGQPQYTAEGGAVGSGGTMQWIFTAVEPGTNFLPLLYRRPSEREAAETFQVTVVVQE